MTWNQYVSRHLVGRTQTSLAADVGVSNTAISRWLKGSQGVDAGVAIRFARAVGDDPLTALIEAGYLTPDEAGAAPALPADTSDLSFDELLDLVRERYQEAVDDLDPAAMAEVVHRFGRRTDDREDRDPWFLTEEEQEMLAARRGPSEGKDFRRRHDAEAEAPDADPGDHIA